MQIVPAHVQGARCELRTETFSGSVWADPLVATEEVALQTVHFAPAATTHWHSHEAGQILHVLSGQGWVNVRGEVPQRIRSGDVVWSPPSEVHWHGAAADAFLVHLAIPLGRTEWLEPVSEADYAQTSVRP